MSHFTAINSNLKIITLFQRIKSVIIDWFVLLILRLAVLLLLIRPINDIRNKFIKTFYDTFHEQYPHIDNPEHYAFVMHSDLFLAFVGLLIIFVIIGILYHGIMLSTKKRASIGQRICNVYVVMFDGTMPSKLRCWVRTLCSYIPLVLLPLAAYYWNISTFISLSLIILISFWHDMSIFVQRGVTLHDLLSKTILVNK